VPEFVPTSEPALDTIFNDYREKVFIPTSLSQTHQRLIYRPTRQDVLTNDPGVSVSITDEEEVQLKPMKMTERPNKIETFKQILDIYKNGASDEAWQNVYPFLHGLKDSPYHTTMAFVDALARYANVHGKHQVFMECIEYPQDTGVRLCHPYVTEKMFLGCHDRAVAAGFKGYALKESRTLARRLVALMEKEDHCRGRIPDKHYDMRHSLMVHGVLLELNAAAGDNIPELQNAVSRVLALSEDQQTGAVDLSFPEFESSHARALRNPWRDIGAATIMARSLIPLWSGMKFASKVPKGVRKEDKTAFAQRFQEVSQMLQDRLQLFREVAAREPEKPRELERFVAAIEKIHGPIGSS
jgi:hypothetical protein